MHLQFTKNPRKKTHPVHDMVFIYLQLVLIKQWPTCVDVSAVKLHGWLFDRSAAGSGALDESRRKH